MGRLIQEDIPYLYTATYTYGKFGRTGYTLKYNNTVVDNKTYQYYDDGKLKSVSSGTGSSYQAIGYEYDTSGNLTGRLFYNGSDSYRYRQYFNYNLAGLAIYTNGDNVSTSFTYKYDLSGKLTATTNPSIAYVNNYDALGRLQSEEEYLWANTLTKATEYFYDDSGNRTRMTVRNGSGTKLSDTDYIYDKANRLLRRNELNTSDSREYAYDASGNLTNEKTTAGTVTASYTYNSWNLCTGARGITYNYDGLGRRHSKTVDSTTTRHIWDGDEITYDNRSGTGYDYIHGLGSDGMIISGVLYANILNSQGDVILTVKFSGANMIYQNEANYGSFGNKLSSRVTVNYPYGYRGEYTDENGLQYLRARYYDPETGRFTQQDDWLRGRTSTATAAGIRLSIYSDPNK